MAKVVLKVSKSGDPKVPVKTDFDIRDKLAELVGSGNALSPDNKMAIYGSLVASLGKEKATKIMDHAYIFNSRNDLKSLPLEDKLRRFYDIGSSDPEISDVLGKSKSLGYGILPGLRQSSSALNQEITGRVRPVDVLSPNTEVQNRAMIRVNNR